MVLSVGDAREEESLGVRLLADIQVVFKKSGVHRLPTISLLKSLSDMEDAPWGGFHKGDGMNGRDMAGMLKSYGINPKFIRDGDEVFKGYEANDFDDSWSRYACNRNLSVTTVTPDNDAVHGSDHPPTVINNAEPSTALRSPVTDATPKLRLQDETPDEDLKRW